MSTLFRWTGVVGLALVAGLASCSGGDDDPIDPDPDPTGSVRATVTGDGAALAGVTVRLFANGGTSALESGTTASNGQVTFADVDVGAYDVEVVLPTGFELASGQSLRVDVTVAEDQVATATFALEEIVVPPTVGAIGARVLEGTEGVPDVSVNLYAAGGSTVMETLTTGSDGRVTFSDLAAGSYDVEIELPEGFVVAGDDTTRKEVAVTAGATAQVEFAVDGPDVVTITAEGTSFSPATVTIAPGTVVRWVRVNGSHTVTPTGHTEWTSSALDGTTTMFEHTFDTAGTFPYHCQPHESLGMTGTITVQ